MAASFHITLLTLLLLVTSSSPLAFNYQQFSDMDIGSTLNVTGDVSVDNGSLQLTKLERDSLGRVIYYKQLHLWDKNSSKTTDFTTHFSISINTPNKSYDGDGITFFLAQPDFPLPVPRDGSGIGLVSRVQLSNQNYTTEHPFVAVEFDTFRNTWDPPYDHVGIDVNSIATAYTTEWFSSRDERGYDVDISYNSGSNNLSVSFTGYKDNITKIEQSFSSIVSLRDVLPEWVEFGFTSATGDYYEYHTLSSWSFSSTLDLEAQNDSKGKKGLVIGLSIGGVCVLIGVLGLACFVRWKQRNNYNRGRESFDLAMDNDFERSIGPKKFSYGELATATNNFAKEQKIGEGGFGGVYRGFLRDLNMHVAIKKVSPGSQQGVREYASEVKIISQLRHKNLVQLVGWCHQQNDLLLVYEFVKNGSLDLYLFKGKGVLTWEARYNIARGMATSILYLHEEWDHCVLHRDIKSSNVMLDSNFNAKLGDFGLARLMDHGIVSKTASLAGTVGYLSPEAATRGKASKEADVYSFGVVALEIACGRRVIDRNLEVDQVCLVDWVWELYGMGGDLLRAADPRLFGDFNQQEMERLMMVGLWCTHKDYLMRPTIRQVVNVLNFEAPIPVVPLQLPDSTYHTTASGNNSQTGPSTSSNSSFTKGSSSHTSNSTTSEPRISPSSKLLHTF